MRRPRGIKGKPAGELWPSRRARRSVRSFARESRTGPPVGWRARLKAEPGSVWNRRSVILPQRLSRAKVLPGTLRCAAPGVTRAKLPFRSASACCYAASSKCSFGSCCATAQAVHDVPGGRGERARSIPSGRWSWRASPSGSRSGTPAKRTGRAGGKPYFCSLSPCRAAEFSQRIRCPPNRVNSSREDFRARNSRGERACQFACHESHFHPRAPSAPPVEQNRTAGEREAVKASLRRLRRP
jgi:hypothetical protein